MVKLTKKIATEKPERSINEIEQIAGRGRKAPEFKKWKRDTEIAISYIFGDKSQHLNDFNKISYSLGAYSASTPDSEFERAFRRGLSNARAVLESMLQEIQEYWDEEKKSNEENIEATPVKERKIVGKDVFLIHGHNEGLKESVARFLSKIGLNPVILHEQPNEGRTIIEKFEDFASTSYAIGIFTPDDLGGSVKSPENLQNRARQNVVFEFGFFIGKLGRKNVTALYEEGVELPSDYSGVVYIPLDSSGTWKFMLVRELKSAGFDIDANRAL